MSSRTRKLPHDSILSKIMMLTPTEFEHLVFDLLILSGLRNAVWRTPGADGGRDIEGQYMAIDFSENLKIERWYIECKRYETTLDWPTVYGKIAFADNHNADYLLFITTSALSPRSKEELVRRENDRKRPFIRFWDGTILESVVRRHPVLLMKFGLLADHKTQEQSVMPPLALISKSIQAAYGKAILTDSVAPALELSAALVDLISARLTENSRWGGMVRRKFIKDRDLYDWCTINPEVSIDTCDSYGLRALFCAIRFCLSMPHLEVKKSEKAAFQVSVKNKVRSSVINELVSQICIWSNIEVHFDEDAIVVKVREGV